VLVDECERGFIHLKRSFGLRRTRLRRLAGAKTWVRLGIFAYNLQRMTVITG
jgi:transposase, IS5 family